MWMLALGAHKKRGVLGREGLLEQLSTLEASFPSNGGQ